MTPNDAGQEGWRFIYSRYKITCLPVPERGDERSGDASGDSAAHSTPNAGRWLSRWSMKLHVCPMLLYSRACMVDLEPADSQTGWELTVAAAITTGANSR